MLKILFFVSSLLLLLTACNDAEEGCGGQPPPPFRAVVVDENDLNLLFGDRRPDQIDLFSINGNVRNSIPYDITDVSEEWGVGLYVNFLPFSDGLGSKTYYLEMDGDIDTLQVDIVSKKDIEGCGYLDYESVKFNLNEVSGGNSSSNFYGIEYILRKQ